MARGGKRFRAQIPQRTKKRIYRRDIVRVMTFEGTEDGRVVFATLYTAFLAGPPAQDREQNRVINKVTEKFDEISFDAGGVDEHGNKKLSRKLNEDGAVVRFEDAEFDLLKTSMDAFTKGVPRAWGKRIEDAYEFLDGCPVEKVEASTPKKGSRK